MEPTSNKPRAPRFSVGGLSDEYHPRRLALALSPSKFWESNALLSETTGGNDSTMNPLHYQDNRTHQYDGGNVAAKGASYSIQSADFQIFQTEPPVAISTISNDGGIQTMDRRGLKLLKAADGAAYPYSSTVKEAQASESDEFLSSDDDDYSDDDAVDDNDEDEDYEDLPNKVVRSKSKNEKTSEKGSYLNHEGIPYICSYVKNGIAKYRCYLYLPSGTSVTSQDAQWTRYQAARDKSPLGVKLQRCSGAISVNQVDNTITITTAHECTCTLATTATEKSGRGGVVARASPPLIAAAMNSNNKVLPKTRSHVHYGGVPYICSGTTNGVSRFRCFLYRPTNAVTMATVWTDYAKAKKQNGGVKPYRCPGTMILDNNKDEGYVLDVAHECGHAFVAGPTLAGENEGGCTASNSSLVRHRAEPMNSASTTTSHRGNIVRKMNDRALIAKSSAHTRSSREIQPKAMQQQHGPTDRTITRDEMKSDVPGLADFEHSFDDDNTYDDISLASDNEDVNSVASDKSYYKGLCSQLTEALTTRKDENKEFKKENKVLRKENKTLKKENTDVNTRLSNTADYKRKNKRLKKENADLQEEILKRRSDTNEYKLKNKRLKKENKDLKEKLAEISDNNNYNQRRKDHHTSSRFSAKYA
jgi:hypothetical protein